MLSRFQCTFAEDPASAKDPLKPFFLNNPEPKTHPLQASLSIIIRKHQLIEVSKVKILKDTH